MRNKRFSRKKVLLTAGGLALVLIALVMGYQYARNLEVSSFPAAELKGYTSVNAYNRRFTYGDKEYIFKNDMTTILFMGIDKPSTAEEPDLMHKFRSGGQADFLMLFVVDHNTKKITRMMIDRDTIAEITTLGVLGNEMGTRYERLSISHAFGVGGEQSALLTIEAVSRWLLDIDINYYVAMNLDGIPLLNDAVGGVTVKLDDDLTQFDPSFIPGAVVTLRGEQTSWFVRTRMTIGDGTNESRMRRQRVYLNALADIISDRIHTNVNWIDKLFDALQGSMVSNMSRGRMVNEAYKAMEYETGPLDSLPGVHEIDYDGFMAFYPDEEKMTQWVLDTFTEAAPVSAN
ncbi:hypothetical protein FACS1894184_06470 [Clostridia bacterium]|nr:hypothetical protein FACS1894184_06470 [Clostridia bacterium]